MLFFKQFVDESVSIAKGTKSENENQFLTFDSTSYIFVGFKIFQTSHSQEKNPKWLILIRFTKKMLKNVLNLTVGIGNLSVYQIT